MIKGPIHRVQKTGMGRVQKTGMKRVTKEDPSPSVKRLVVKKLDEAIAIHEKMAASLKQIMQLRKHLAKVEKDLTMYVKLLPPGEQKKFLAAYSKKRRQQ